MKRIKSYYDVLGVQKKVGTDEIRRAYMGKAKTCHPGKCLVTPIPMSFCDATIPMRG